MTDNGGVAPFNNNSFATAQFLGTVRSTTGGDVIHLQGTIEGAQPGLNRLNNTVDYFAFGMLAGQTVTVSVIPRDDPNATATPDAVDYAIFNPDGVMIAR